MSWSAVRGVPRGGPGVHQGQGWPRSKGAIPGDVRVLARGQGPRPQPRDLPSGFYIPNGGARCDGNCPPTPPHRPASIPSGFANYAPTGALPYPRMKLPVKNTFIEFPPETPSRSEPQRMVGSCPSRLENKENVEIQAVVPAQPVPLPFQSDTSDGPEQWAKLSVGSALHSSGTCKPCAWYHHAKGCQRGSLCEFCHACPPGEIKRRKKEKYRIIRERRTDDMQA